MIVREMINFDRSESPKSSLTIGKKAMIVNWLGSMGFTREDYDLNDDLSINVYFDVNLINKGLTQLPEFIKFDRIAGSFYAGQNNWTSLKGFPNEIVGDLQTNSGKIKNRINKNEIRKLIKVHGTIWN